MGPFEWRSQEEVPFELRPESAASWVGIWKRSRQTRVSVCTGNGLAGVLVWELFEIDGL